MIKSILRICAALGCCLLTSVAIQAQTNIYLVSPNGGNTATSHTTVMASDWAGASSLQAALAAANADIGTPEIWMHSGKYQPAATARDSSFVITKDGLKLYGGFAGGETTATQRDPVANPDTLSGDIGTAGVNTDNSYHVMIVYALNGNISSNTIIDGVTITAGYSDNAGYTTTLPQIPGHEIYQGYAAGMLLSTNDDGTFYYNSGFTYYGVSPTITRCGFVTNASATSSGGTVYCLGSNALCAPSFTGCKFIGNTASGTSSGGAINFYYSSGAQLGLAAINITNCSFSNNRAFSGAGVHVNSSAATPMQVNMKGCTFAQNIAVNGNGGAFDFAGPNLLFKVDSSSFLSDTARVGGAVFAYGNSTILDTLVMTNCYFYSNRAYTASNSSFGQGGAMNIQSCTAILNNCVFTQNGATGTNGTSTTGGGAINASSSSGVILNNCTLYNDYALAAGGVRVGSNEILAQLASSSVTINNSILWNNFSDTTVVKATASATVTYNYSDVRGVPASGNNVLGDPVFVDPNNPNGADNMLHTSDDGLTITYAGSPALNAGSNALAPAGTDFAGNTRIQNTTVDMGAYETSVPTVPYNALAFDGINDYVVSANNISITGAQPRTIEYWAKLSNVYAHQLDWGTTNTTGAVFGTYTDGAGHLEFYGWGTADFATGFVPDGAMHHVAVSYDGTYVRVYVDGALTSAGAVARTLNTGNGHVFLGVREDMNSSTYSNTTLDEVRVWNRALCQAEILNNKNGELPNPASQSGLVLYYKFDQGTASGYNVGTTTATDASASGNNGTLNNFALTGGGTSNFVTGTPAITGDVAQYAPATPSSSTESGSKPISGSTTINGCGVIATVAPSGASPVSGTVTGKVTEDASVQSYGGHAYVQRHYDITPASNASTATGTITLYFTQADFTAYNAANGIDPDLPTTTSNSDPNISHLHITQYHGTGTLPGNYTGSAVQISPTSVTYNTTAVRWEVIFPVNGFSGFYASGTINSPLPVTLTAFTALPAGRTVNIGWKVAEQKNMAWYTIERSADGNNFSYLTTQKAMDSKADYTAADKAPYDGVSYYRLRMEGLAGEVTYSSNQRVTMADGNTYFRLSPVPVTSTLTLETNDALLSGTTALIGDLQGRTLMTFVLGSGRQSLSLDGLQPGTYFLRLTNGMSYRLIKQ